MKENTPTNQTAALLPAVPENIVNALDAVASNKALSAVSQFQRAFAVAGAISQLRALLTPAVMQNVMALQNNALGFMTDHPENPYSVDIVRDALIEAVLSGVSPIGNEFNIISKRCYITKAGMKHKLRDIEGLSFAVTPGLPKMAGETGAALIVSVDWEYNGKTGHKDLPVAVRVNRGMGSDAILGKAMRKAYAWLWEIITGQNVNEGDVTDDTQSVPSSAGADASGTVIDTTATTAAATPAKPAAASADGELPM